MAARFALFGIFFVQILAALRGSLDACESEPIFESIRQRLYEVLSHPPLSEAHKRFSDDVFAVYPPYPESLDGSDCWLGIILPSLVSASLSIDRFLDFTYYLQVLFSLNWDYTLFESSWPVIDSLSFISHSLAPQISDHPCTLSPPSTLLEAAEAVYAGIQENENSVFSLDHLDVCGRLQFLESFLQLSLESETSAVGYTAAFYDIPRVIGNLLAENSVLVMSKVTLWDRVSEIRYLHNSLTERYDRGSYSDQLESIETNFRSETEFQCTLEPASSVCAIPEAFRPVQSEEDRKLLVHSLATVASVLDAQQPFLMAGTALGAMRYQAINPWEHDAEIAIDTRHHWAVVRVVVEQFARPEMSILRRANVRLDLAVRRGYSHKFYPFDWEDPNYRNKHISVYVEETPGTQSVYPHGDVIEVSVTNDWVGQVHGWKSEIANVLPLKKQFPINGVLLYTPANLEEYVNDYFRSFYLLEENFRLVCRGHRNAVNNTVACAELDDVFPRVATSEDFRCHALLEKVGLAGDGTCVLSSGDFVLYIAGMRKVGNCEEVVVAWPVRAEVPRFYGYVPPEEMKFSRRGAEGSWNYGVLSGVC